MKKFLLMFTLVWLVIFWCNYSYARNGITYNNNLTTWTDLNWNSFSYWTITIEHDWDSITMMDRNLWATTNNINNRRSYGYYYQWWNNYWFDPFDESVENNAISERVDASGYWPWNYFFSGVFRKIMRDWSSSRNDNLRWWGRDSQENNRWLDSNTEITYRQWPCPDWYHVPSLWEWNKTLEYWVEENKDLIPDERLVYHENWSFSLANNVYICYDENWHKTDCVPEGNVDMEYLNYDNEFLLKIQQDFKIPFAGLRVGDSTQIGVMGINAHLWSSSPAALGFDSARSFDLHTGGVGTTVTVWRAGWLSVRCFKNPVNSTVNEDISFSIDIDSTTKVWKTEFVVKVMKDWAIFRDYTGTVYIYLTDKYWNTTDEDIYEFSDGKKYKFSKSDRWKKTFSVKIEEEWTYVLRINDLSNDEIKWNETITVKWNSNNSNFEYDYSKFNPYYSDEMNMAYQYAYHYWITTINNINNANMNWSLNRIAMAKMLSYFAENVLWMDDFDTRRNCEFNDVPSYLDRQYNYWVTKACQLGIMWINMQNNNFNPYWTVTRAQFATALSRLLYWTKDWTYNYYSTHISKLYKEWIISNTNPNLTEKRWYVMLMLMRSQDGWLTPNNSSATYHSPNMIDITSFLGLNNVDTTCNWTDRTIIEKYGNYYVYVPNSTRAADVRFVNNALQDVWNNWEYLVENYIKQANDILDSNSLTSRDRCRYSFLIYALENQKWDITSYKTENWITTIWVDFYSYKETLDEYDRDDDDAAGWAYVIYKNTSKKSRNYVLSSNAQLEILNIDSNWYTNCSCSCSRPWDRTYIFNRNTWVNTYCNNEIVYNWKSPYPDGNWSNYNWNTNNALCIKDRLSSPMYRQLSFTFDDWWNISKIWDFYYWLCYHP